MEERDWSKNMDRKSSLNVAVSGKHTGAMGHGGNVEFVEMFHD